MNIFKLNLGILKIIKHEILLNDYVNMVKMLYYGIFLKIVGMYELIIIKKHFIWWISLRIFIGVYLSHEFQILYGVFKLKLFLLKLIKLLLLKKEDKELVLLKICNQIKWEKLILLMILINMVNNKQTNMVNLKDQ